jgi:hypothetical protein
MAKFRVTIKYGDPGKSKNNSRDVTVEAGSESVAMQLAVNQFKSSASSYGSKEVDVVKIKAL